MQQMMSVDAEVVVEVEPSSEVVAPIQQHAMVEDNVKENGAADQPLTPESMEVDSREAPSGGDSPFIHNPYGQGSLSPVPEEVPLTLSQGQRQALEWMRQRLRQQCGDTTPL